MGIYAKELLELQTWLKKTAGLNSYRVGVANSNARPVVALEMPSTRTDRTITQYQYIKAKRQYCKLYVNHLDELLEIQEKLEIDLEERYGTLEIKEGAETVGKLKAVKINFQEADGLVVPFNIEYEVTYSRTKPTEAPNATKIVTKQTIHL